MGGKIVFEPHNCDTPSARNYAQGSIWLCDCGRYHRNLGLIWHPISPIEVCMMRAMGQILRDLSKSVPKEVDK